MSVSVDTTKVNKYLSEINERFVSLKENPTFLAILSANVYKDIIDHFKNEEGPTEGTFWAAWSDAYAKHAQKNGRKKILQWSGKLRQSFTPSNYRQQKDGILFYNNAKTSSGFPYAWHHNFGNSTGQGQSRTFMWISDKAMNQVVESTIRWIATGKK